MDTYEKTKNTNLQRIKKLALFCIGLFLLFVVFALDTFWVLNTTLAQMTVAHAAEMAQAQTTVMALADELVQAQATATRVVHAAALQRNG